MIDPHALPSPEDVEKLATTIGIGALSHLSEGRESNADVLKQAHAYLRLCAELIRRQQQALQQLIGPQHFDGCRCKTCLVAAILKGTPR